MTTTSGEASKGWRVILVGALVVLLAYTWAFLVLMSRRGEDISIFVVAGGDGLNAERVPPGLTIIPGIDGYDGLAFYRLALDPFTRDVTDFGIPLDNPPYRQQRILYPLIVHVLVAGHVEAIPTFLVVVNLAAVVLLTIGAGRIAELCGISPLWGAMIPLYPGFFIAFSRDTSEIVAWTFAVWGIAMLGVARWKTAALLLCLAVLSRESTLILPGSMLLVWGWSMARGTARPFAAVAFSPPLLVYVAWQSWLHFLWNESGLEAGSFEASTPFSGFLQVFAEAAIRRTVQMRVHFAECILLCLVVAAVLLVLRRTKTPLQWRVAWIAYLALGSTLGRDVWSEHISFMRVLGDFFATSAIVLFGAAPQARWIVATASVAVSAYAISHMG